MSKNLLCNSLPIPIPQQSLSPSFLSFSVNNTGSCKKGGLAIFENILKKFSQIGKRKYLSSSQVTPKSIDTSERNFIHSNNLEPINSNNNYNLADSIFRHNKKSLSDSNMILTYKNQLKGVCQIQQDPNCSGMMVDEASINNISLNGIGYGKRNHIRSCSVLPEVMGSSSLVNEEKNIEVFLIQELPEELLLLICSYFTLDMVFRFSMVNQKYYKFLQELTIWKSLVQNRFNSNKDSLLSAGKIYNHQWKNYCQLKTIYSKKGAISSFYLRCKGGPTARYQHTGTVIGNSIYYIGGQETQVKRFNDIYRFDTDKSKFTRIEVEGSNQPPKFARHTAVALKHRIYVFGGFDGSGVYFDLAIFDTKTHHWEVPTVQGTPPRSRTNHASAAVGTDLYIFGGINRDGNWELQDLDEFYVLDTLTLTWREVEATGDIPTARCGHRLVAMGKKLYLFGGGSGDNWSNKMNEFYIFDTVTKVWRKTPSDPIVQVCTFSCVFAMGPLLCVFAGQHLIRGKVTKKFYIFDTISETWIKQSFSSTLFPSARDMATANVINDRVYIYGGYDGRPMDELNILELSPKLKKLINLNYTPLSSYN